LAQIFLMNAYHLVPDLTSVVTVYDNRRLIGEAGDPRVHGYEADATGSIEAKMLVEIMIVQAGDGWFEDVGRRGCTARDAPSTVSVQQSSLSLGSCEAELAGEQCAEPCG